MNDYNKDDEYVEPLEPWDEDTLEVEGDDLVIDPFALLRGSTKCARKECGCPIKRGRYRLTVLVTRLVGGIFTLEQPQSFCTICIPLMETLAVQLATIPEWKPPENLRSELYRMSGTTREVRCTTCWNEGRFSESLLTPRDDRISIGIHQFAHGGYHDWRDTEVLHFHPDCVVDKIYNPALVRSLLEQMEIRSEKLEEAEPVNRNAEIKRLKKQQGQEKKLGDEFYAKQRLWRGEVTFAGTVQPREDDEGHIETDSDAQDKFMNAVISNPSGGPREKLSEHQRRIGMLWGLKPEELARIPEPDQSIVRLLREGFEMGTIVEMLKHLKVTANKITKVFQTYAPRMLSEAEEALQRMKIGDATGRPAVVQKHVDYLRNHNFQQKLEDFLRLKPEEQLRIAQRGRQRGGDGRFR